MRKFNFNNFKRDNTVISQPTTPQKPRYSAYRTIISKHDQLNKRLEDEPRAVIKND